jgi:3-hydroxybutyrate dehydrogenase
VTVLDLDRDGAERVAGEVGGVPLVVDLARPQQLDGLELAADVLVNNAGFQHVAPVEEFPPERFSACLRSCWRRRSGWPGRSCPACTGAAGAG